MGLGQSILGDHRSRIKTDVRLVPKLANHVEQLCEDLGVPKNVFYTLAACKLAVELAPLLSTKKSDNLQKDLLVVVQKILQALIKRQ